VAIGAVSTSGHPSCSSSGMVRASSGGAPAHPRQPAASPLSPQAPPRLQLRRAVVEIGAARAKEAAQFGYKIRMI
jgi:hypothetical protein